MTPPPPFPAAPLLLRPTTFSYALLFATLVLVGALNLTTPFVTVLFSYLLLERLHFARRGPRWVAVGLFLVIIAALFYGFTLSLRRAWVVFPEIAATVIPAVVRFATEHGIDLPFEDLESLRALAMDSVRDTLGYVGNFAKIATKESIFLIIGVVVAVGIFLNPELDPDRQRHPRALYSVYSDAVAERFRGLYRAFRTVMGAQVVISGINTFATALFVFSTHMRFAPVLVLVTFGCGLLPVIGNLLSNTVIVGVALTSSPRFALSALVFLVVIHKLEYFLNSKIIGGRIRYPMWLTLLALILGERLLGIAGLILAPVILNFVKVETTRAEVKVVPATPNPAAVPAPAAVVTRAEPETETSWAAR